MKSWGFCYSTSKFFFFLFLIFSYFVFSSFLVKTTKYFQNSRKRKFYSAVRALFSIKYIFSRQRIFVFWLCHCSFRKPYLCSLLVFISCYIVSVMKVLIFLLFCVFHGGSCLFQHQLQSLICGGHQRQYLLHFSDYLMSMYPPSQLTCSRFNSSRQIFQTCEQEIRWLQKSSNKTITIYFVRT